MNGGPEPKPNAALVTGAGGRIGRAIACALGAEGRPVAVHYNKGGDGAAETVALIEAGGGKAIAIQADLADSRAAEGLIPKASETLNGLGLGLGDGLSCLVNNASHFAYDELSDIEASGFDRHMAVNARGPALLSKAFAKHIAANGAAHGASADTNSGAVIVNILDQKLFNPDPDYLSYTISKFALEGLTRTLALALAPTIRVVGVAPGVTLPSGELDAADFEKIGELMPLGRSTAVEDIAATVCYVATARSITGQTVTVDAGQHLRLSGRDIAFENQ
jgi:NAD(P)-dependent dehydrogenase (short-subunit alcohol dehydrogenase family)